MVPNDFHSLTRAPAEALVRLSTSGTAPGIEDLAGWEYRGWLCAGSLPGPVMRKHRKGFYRLARRGRLGGYNIPCHPGPARTPWVDRLRGPGSWRLGWFLVAEGDGSLLLDYSRDDRASLLSPVRGVREHLVQVRADDPTLLVSAIEILAGSQVRRIGMGIYERHTRSPLGI
jgi:hypothetical protein